jgi:ribonuclease R
MSAESNPNSATSGLIVVRPNGDAWFLPQDRPEQKIAVAHNQLLNAMHEDTVLCSIELPARVTSVVERGHTQWVGQVRSGSGKGLFIPDAAQFPAMAIVGPVPPDGSKVQAGLVSWDNPMSAPLCVIREVLGQHREPTAELKGVCLQHQIPSAFTAEEIQSAQDAQPFEGVREEVLDTTITIDPSNSRDYDDALSYRAVNGERIVGVHIADVAAWLPKGEMLDRAALRRGNSTYCVGKVFPMLPETLSNEKCSLKEGKRRLTLSVFLTFDPQGRCVATRFARTAITSAKRFSYEQIMAVLQAPDPARIVWPQPPLSNPGRDFTKLPLGLQKTLFHMIRDFGQIAQDLRRERLAQGSLELDSPQFRFTTDAAGYADDIQLESSDPSHQLIEEFMLMANKAVGRFLREKNVPIPYRIHEPPTLDKVESLRKTLACFGETAPDFNDRKSVIGKLVAWRTHPYGHFLRRQLLFCSSKAKYAPDTKGHYGLGFSDYAHFTSPIRRYADVMVHRSLIAHLEGVKPDALEAVQPQCEHISACEVRSSLAERDYARIKAMEYAERVLMRHHTPLEAVVTNIFPNGVEFDILVAPLRGFFSGRQIRGDFLPGVMPRWNTQGETWQMGDRIRVKVREVRFEEHKVDFTLLPSVAQAPTPVATAQPKPGATGRGRHCGTGHGQPPQGQGRRTNGRRHRHRRRRGNAGP